MFNRLLTALAALALSPVAVFADVYEDHNVLYNSLEQVGVTLRVNNPDLCGDLGTRAGCSGLLSRDEENSG